MNVRSVDVPQADRLDVVRNVVLGISERAADVAREAGISARHLACNLHAARILGLLEDEVDGGVQPTARARALLETSPPSRRKPFGRRWFPMPAGAT